MLQLRKATSLGGGNFGWLKAKHHFNVTPDGNPEHGPLGSLVVWNDDEIAPGTGFGMHGHTNMEIISYVRDGAVTHQDSIGNKGVTKAGDVQVMSAGSGIRHAERNEGAGPLKLFQIWIKPNEDGGTPRWDTRRFPKTDRANQLVVLASGLTDDTDALPIRANARVLGATLLAGAQVRYELGNGHKAYLAPAQGAITVNGQRLNAGDGIAASGESELTIVAEQNAEFVLVDAV